jgi:hypothetical protein
MTWSLRTASTWLLVAALAWQAAAGTAEALCTAWHSRGETIAARLSGDTAERVRARIGADADLAAVLAAVARTGETAYCGVPTAAAAFGHDGVVIRLTRMRHVLFPTPVLAYGGIDPAAAAEATTHRGASALALVARGEPSPQGRAGWTRLHADEGHEVWRLQR